MVRRRALHAARALTTPLLPDDYIELLNPMWSTRELRGEIVSVQEETPDASTVVVRPSFPWPGHKPGQYLRIGVEINGIRHWRAYSLTSDPEHPKGFVSITVKHVAEGKLSPYFTRRAKPGSVVFLGDVEGTFTLPDPLPDRFLFVSAGSGVTPVMSMLRELERRGRLDDVVHLHSERRDESVIFSDMLGGVEKRNPGYARQVRLTSKDKRISPGELDELCPDWRDRESFMSGPGELLDTMFDHWEEHGDGDRVHMERFQPVIGTGDAEVGAGGTVRFRLTEIEATCEQGVSILVGGENAGATLPFGCRMGICHTCVGRLCHGKVRDLRTGEVHGEEGELIRTCVNAPEGEIEIEEGHTTQATPA
jgi:ferredoxin-NADP reductase